MSALPAPAHRGLVLDLLVFTMNVAVLGRAGGWFAEVARRAGRNDQVAVTAIVVLVALLTVLAPLGATLKRWHYHRRRGLAGNPLGGNVAGCLFNPLMYFCLVVVIFSAVNAFLLQGISGRRDPGAFLMVSSIFGGLVLMLAHTWLVYRYFSPPKREPRTAFGRGPASELLGDACLFANMFIFQLFWNLIALVELPPPGGAVDVLVRLFILGFLALLLYFPPRMFYLAEDIHRWWTWPSILLANSPVILRVMLGA